jgi:uncharacterized repeat protein (TIGR01451 family)
MRYLTLLALTILSVVQLQAQSVLGKFNGNSSYVNLGTTISTGVRTVQFTFRPDVNRTPLSNDIQILVGRSQQQNLNDWVVLLGGSSFGPEFAGRVVFGIRDGNVPRNVFSTTSNFSNSQYYHVCVTIDPEEGMKMYINGVLEGTNEFVTDAIVESPDSVYIGVHRHGSGPFIRHFDGQMEELSFWNTHFTEEQVLANMCNYLNVEAGGGLTHYFKFNEYNGDTLVDEMTSNHGTVSSMTWIEDETCFENEIIVEDNSVVLTVFHDENENGVYDAEENVIPYFPIETNPLGILYTSGVGKVITTIGEVSSFEINVDDTNWEPTTDSVIEVDETEWTGSALFYYFGVKPTANTEISIEASLSGITPLCNSMSFAHASIFNNGIYYPGGVAVVTVDPLYTFVSSSPQPSNVSGNTLTYEIEPLFYHELKTINLILQNPTETAFGEETSHNIEGYYRIDENTLSSVQDSDQVQHIIICAYDPNDKLTHTGTGEQGFIDPNTDMEYTINFQNIGNAPATNVVVTDEISDLLDITSLQPIAWSHDFVLQVVENVATFRFEDIQLLGAEQDEELSKGFVRFKIKQQPNLAPGTLIENIAEIVFDNNEAIITNTAVNTIITPTGVAEVSSVNLGIYPNPATDVVYWSNNDYRLTKVVNALGMVIAIPSSNGEMQFNVSQLASGTYVLEFEGVDGTMVRKQIIKS